jgi:hypothetical protein
VLTGRANKQEKRGYMFGKIFAVLVLCRADRLSSLSGAAAAAMVKELLRFDVLGTSLVFDVSRIRTAMYSV